MNQKKIKFQNHISIEQFLRDFVGLADEATIEKFVRMEHWEFKYEFFRKCGFGLETMAFTDVEIEDVLEGRVLLVLDGHSKSAPYVNPRQSNFDRIIEAERERLWDLQYNYESREQSYEDWVDSLDDMVSDKGTTSRQIKVLSLGRNIERVREHD